MKALRALTVIFVLLFGAASAAAPENPNGLALVYAEFPAQDSSFDKSWRISANITLPERANKDWYSNWIMLIGYAPDGSGPNFVQMGVLRNPKQGNELHAFIASQRWPPAPAHPAQRPPLTYQDLGAVNEGPHLFAITKARDGITFAIKQKIVSGNAAIGIANPFGQAGAETHAIGDVLAGSFALLELWSNDDVIRLAPRQAFPDCVVGQYGGQVAAMPSGALQFSGTVNMSAPATFSAGCSTILRNHAPSH